MSAATDHQPSDSRDHRSGHVTEPSPPARNASRGGGYVGQAVVNIVLILLVNRWPGWQAVPFLTDETPRVLGLVNASLFVAVVVNFILAVADPPRLKALGDLVIGGVGAAALVRIWQVFPLDLQGGWETLARVLLVVGLVGTGIAVLVALVRLVRGGRNGQ